ncbi:MAG: hypothetical protein AB1416_04845 [Actinomycetota bacterium]
MSGSAGLARAEALLHDALVRYSEVEHDRDARCLSIPCVVPAPGSTRLRALGGERAYLARKPLEWLLRRPRREAPEGLYVLRLLTVEDVRIEDPDGLGGNYLTDLRHDEPAGEILIEGALPGRAVARLAEIHLEVERCGGTVDIFAGSE